MSSKNNRILLISIFTFFSFLNLCFGKDIESSTLSIQVENATLVDIFITIKSKSDYRFSYGESVLNNQETFTVNYVKVSLEEILKDLSEKADFEYTIKNKVVFVKKNAKTSSRQNQSQRVKGVVVDNNGEPLPGVNVLEKGTSNGVITELDGSFSLEVSGRDAVLVISYIGFTTQEIPVGTKSQFEIALELSSANLEEVILIGYKRQKKETLTGSASQIEGKRLQNRVVSNPIFALQGAIPNLNISVTNAGGEPGATPDINIRGYSSISGGQPLIIVDGVEQNLSHVNPTDIESVSVLKDAAATAIYGTRAAFGVINIKTKQGNNMDGKVTFNLRSNIAFKAPTQLPEMPNSVEFLETQKEAYANSGQTSNWPEETLERARENLEKPGSVPTLIPSPSDPTRWGNWGYSPYASANVDWYDVFYDSWAFAQMHNLSVNGGGQQSQYYLSVGYFDEDGQFNYSRDDFKHYNLTANVDTKITDWFTVRFKNRYSHRNINKPTYYSGAGSYEHALSKIPPTIPVLDPNGNIYNNALLLLAYGGRNQIKQNELINSAHLVFEPVKNWKINAEFNFRQNFNYSEDHHKTVYRTLVDNETQIKEVHTNPNYFIRESENDFYNTNNLYTSYDLALGRHNFTIMGGFQNELYKYSSLYGRRDNLVTDEVPSISTATGQEYIDDSQGHWSTLSYFGRFNYNFENKYLLEIVSRYNGSSRFAEGKRWSLFPAVSLGYNITNEGFWREQLAQTVSFLKLRASYGENGNQDVPNYLYLSNLGINQNLSWITNGERPVYITASALISPNVTWEKVKTTNYGVDLGFFNDKLSASFDYYVRKTLDMFGPVESLPAILGTSAPTENNADLSTKGFELELGWRDQIGELNYNIQVNLSDNKTTITKYKNDTGILTDYYEGMEIGEIWGYTTAGIYQTNAEAAESHDQSYFYSVWGAGDIMYEDLNGDDKIDPGNNTLDDHGDLSIIGNSSPRFSYGINLGLQWRNFDFSTFWQGVAIRDMMFSRSDIMFWGIYGNGHLVLEEHLDYWSPDNTDAYYPKPYKTSEHYKNTQKQTGYLQDASYLRMKNLQFGYSLPKALCERLFIDGVRVYFTGENLLTFTSLASMFDPEVVGGSWGAGKAYPLSKTVSLGLDIKF